MCPDYRDRAKLTLRILTERVAEIKASGKATPDSLRITYGELARQVFSDVAWNSFLSLRTRYPLGLIKFAIRRANYFSHTSVPEIQFMAVRKTTRLASDGATFLGNERLSPKEQDTILREVMDFPWDNGTIPDLLGLIQNGPPVLTIEIAKQYDADHKYFFVTIMPPLLAKWARR